MNLKKVDDFTKEITTLKNRITYIKKQIRVLSDLTNIDFKTLKTNFREDFEINDRSRFKLEKPIEVFKILALKELNEELESHEKELNDFIKKGITDND